MRGGAGADSGATNDTSARQSRSAAEMRVPGVKKTSHATMTTVIAHAKRGGRRRVQRAHPRHAWNRRSGNGALTVDAIACPSRDVADGATFSSSATSTPISAAMKGVGVAQAGSS
jgi:hypothetical protein